MSEELPIALKCSEHGIVLRTGPSKTPSTIPATFTWFCPFCHRALYADDPLGDIEREHSGDATFDEMLERTDATILRFPPIRLGDDS